MDVFRANGNRVGTFLESNDSFMHSNSYLIACILIEIDMMDGLAKEISIIVWGETYCQALTMLASHFFIRASMCMAIFPLNVC